MIKQNKTILTTEDYTVLLEPREGVLFLHITVHNYTARVLRELRQAWPNVKQYCWGCGYDELFVMPLSVKFMRQVSNDWIQIGDGTLYMVDLEE